MYFKSDNNGIKILASLTLKYAKKIYIKKKNLFFKMIQLMFFCGPEYPNSVQKKSFGSFN